MIRVGVIGYGYWGPNLVRNYHASDKTEIRMVCDLDAERVKKVSKLYPSVKLTTDIDEIINSDEIDALSIATPVSTHYELAMKAMNAGKHVLVEKPIADSSEKCEQMLEAAEKNGVTLMVDHTFPYTAAVRKIRDLVRAGDIGDLYYFDSVRVNLGLFQSDVSVIWDLAVHDLSIMEYVLPCKPIAVTAAGIAHVKDNPVNTAYLTLLYEEDFISHIHVSWLAPVKLRQTLLGGSEKMVVYNDLEQVEKIKVYDKGITVDPSPEDIHQMRIGYRAGDIWAPQIARKEALAELVAHFTDVIDNSASPITSAESGARIVRILEAATESIQDNCKVVTL